MGSYVKSVLRYRRGGMARWADCTSAHCLKGGQLFTPFLMSFDGVVEQIDDTIERASDRRNEVIYGVAFGLLD